MNTNRFKHLVLARLVVLGVPVLATFSTAPVRAEQTSAAPDGAQTPTAVATNTASPAVSAGEPLVNPIRVIPAQPPPGDWYAPSDDPESSAPTPEERRADPLKFGYYLMELVDKGTYALDQGHYSEAVKIYRTMTAAVPERAVAWGRLCEAYHKVGKPKEAEVACAQAVSREGGSLDFHTRYFDLVLLNRAGQLPDADLNNLDVLIENLEKQDETELTAAQLACQLGARLESAERLRECTRVLNERQPNDMFTLTHNWALAVLEHDASAAEVALERAAAAGLAPSFIERMRTANAKLPKRPNAWIIGAASLAVVLGGLVFTFVRRRRGATAHA